jgi:hypothetical protein
MIDINLTIIALMLLGIILVHAGLYRAFGRTAWYSRFLGRRGQEASRPTDAIETKPNLHLGLSMFVSGVVLVIAVLWFSN